MEARRFFLKAIQTEAEGDHKCSISYYKKAFSLDPSLQFYSEETIVVDDVEYDLDGRVTESIEVGEGPGGKLPSFLIYSLISLATEQRLNLQLLELVVLRRVERARLFLI